MKKNSNKLREEFMEIMRKKYNMSWARYLIEINKNNLEKSALFYRGNTIKYGEMFAKAFKYAASLKQMGIKKGMEIPMCLNLCPETIYIIIAASLIGARINLFGNEFATEYIEEIIKSTDAGTLFVTDDMFSKLKDIIPKTDIDRIVMFSLTDSYPKGGNPYYVLEKDFYGGQNKVNMFKDLCSKSVSYPKILDSFEFEASGENYDGQIEEPSSLWDIFTKTYSSGTTNSKRPNMIEHRVSTYIAMGLAHYLGGDTTRLVGVRAYAGIPTFSNTSLVSTISDGFSQEQEIALEYIRNSHFFSRSLQINKPNMCAETTSNWIQAIKDYNEEKSSKPDLSFLLAAFCIGEPTSSGEEKFINKGFRKYKAGHKFTKGLLTLPIGMAGGDCEHSGIFFLPFKKLMDGMPNRAFKTTTGYKTYRMVDWAILDKDGKHCKPYEHGELVANSPCSMVKYSNNDEANERFFRTDEHGKVYGSFHLYAFMDELGGIHLKGRIPKEEKSIPLYYIEDEILKDSKRIMSCSVVEVDGLYVAHIEYQPGVSYSERFALLDIERRLARALPNDILDRIVYKFRTNKDGFPLTGCIKRSPNDLIQEGLIGTYKVRLNGLGEPKLVSGQKYNEFIKSQKSMKLE